MSVTELLRKVRKLSESVSVADHMAALCDDMREGAITMGEAADRLEDLTLLVALRSTPTSSTAR